MLSGISFAANPSPSIGGKAPLPKAVKGSALAPQGGGEGFDFEFSGVFTWGEVITSLCRDGWCRTQLPRDFFDLSVPLNVYEKDFNNAFKALSMQALADGFILKKSGKKKPFLVTVEHDEQKTASYISCLDTTVRTVNASDLYRYRLADSLKCVSKSHSLDSLARLSGFLEFPGRRYRVSFYVVSSSFLRDLGIDWTSIWAKGNLASMPSLISDWALKAVASDDTTAEFRSLEVDLDSSTTLHWGSRKKEEKSTVIYSNGVAQNDYEWRDYGLTLTLSWSNKTGLRAEYELAQRDDNNSILSGNFGGGGLDSISAFGVYDSYQTTFSGIPWLYSFPLIGHLFGIEKKDKVKSFFVITVYRVKDFRSKNFSEIDSLKIEDIKKYEYSGDQDSSDSRNVFFDSSEDTVYYQADSLEMIQGE